MPLCGILALGCAIRLNGNAPLDGDDPAGPDGDDSGSDESPASDQPNEEDPYNCGAATFTLTESQETFEVPDDVSYMKVKAWGAGANGESLDGCATCACNFDDGGLGGYSEAIFSVEPGTTLSVVVGQRGRSGITGESPYRYGFGARGGGGLTGIFTGADEVLKEHKDRALIIAGGGGSAGVGAKSDSNRCRPGGTGNHPNAGGQANMHGQFGADDDINGGGGGYSGGNGGAIHMHGLGGSGFIADDGYEPVMEWSERGTKLPPRTTDPDYDGSAGTTEMPGLLVVQFACEYPGVEEPPDDPDDPPQVD